MPSEYQVHEDAEREVRRRLGATPGFVFEVTGSLNRECFIVSGRADEQHHAWPRGLRIWDVRIRFRR